MKTQPKNFILFFGLAILIFASQTISVFAAPRAVWDDYFGTGKTDYVSLDGTPQGSVFWDVLRNPITHPLQTRRVFWGRFDPQGATGDIPLHGDWDGDFKADVAVWRPGSPQNPQSWFYIQRSSNPNPSAIYGVAWGKSNNFPEDSDFPITGDFDGDGKDDFAVTRIEGNQLAWYILPSGGGTFRRIVFGFASDLPPNSPPAVFDFNGDGRDDLVVTRFVGTSFIHYVGDAQTGNLIMAQQWGGGANTSSVILFGNYLGDSRADIAVVYGGCPSNPNCDIAGTWWIKETGSSNYTVRKWGIPLAPQTGEGDFPDTGDYDGDGKFDISVVRQNNGQFFYTILSSNGQFQFLQWSGLGGAADGSTTLLKNSSENGEREISSDTPCQLRPINNADGKALTAVNCP